MQIITEKWIKPMEGTSIAWANLPHKMNSDLTIPKGVKQLLIFVDMSRVQHNSVNVNTSFRILAEGKKELAMTNTGNVAGFEYRAISFNGVLEVEEGQEINIRVEYKTQSGVVLWADDANGAQERQLTILMV